MGEGFKVTLLSHDISEQTGWGRFTREFCLALHAKGVDFELLLPRRAKVDPALPYADRVRNELPPFALRVGKRIWRCAGLWMTARQISVRGDLIHCLSEFPYGVLAHWLHNRVRRPFGMTLFGTYAVSPLKSFPDRLLFKRALLRAHFLVAISKFTAERVQRALGRRLAISVIHGGVNFPYFAERFAIADEKAIRRLLNIPLDAKIVLSVGALKARKGMDTLLQAFARVVEEEPSAYLIIVGSGDKSHYEEMAKWLGIKDRVRFARGLSDEQLSACYKSCEVFVLLSREDPPGHFEGFGLVYLEANAFGKPVVGTTSGGIPDAIKDGETGLLVPPKDAEAAARAILSLLRDKDLARRLGEQGRCWAKQHDWPYIVERYLQIYKAVLKG